ncbi:MAG: hypothetical protein K2N05_12040 [Muribaculaceae bacterium]|nr:hypothetical protein [Muribaculaceae bacterium]
MKSFKLFWRAIKSTRHEMWVSLQVLVATTLVLSLLLYIVEHNAQPEVFHSYWDAMLWSFMGYIGDPGEFAAYTPITFWGRVLKIACALVNIAIFAVPAGLVAGGFSEAMAEDKREKELMEMRECLKKSFRRKQAKKLQLVRTVPRYVSLTDIQVMQQMDTKDIIDAVRSSDEFRLSNLATALPDNRSPQDRLVIETIPKEGHTSYGCCIDRGSNVTIVAPSVYHEVGSGKFAYYLALFGGFNYISKEYDDMPGEYSSYYLMDEEHSTHEKSEFLADVEKLSKGRDRWMIALIVADSVHKEDFHFVTAVKPELGISSTIIDKEEFDRLYQSVAEVMKSDFDLESDLDERYRPMGSKNICFKAGGGKDCNAFTLRVDWDIVAFDMRHERIIFTMAQLIAKVLENRDIEIKREWKTPGFGYIIEKINS